MRNYLGRAAADADSSSRPRTNSLRATTRRSTPRRRLFGGWLLQARGELADELGRVEPDGLGDLDELDDVEPSLSALVLCDERLGPFEPVGHLLLLEVRLDPPLLQLPPEQDTVRTKG